jgi:hypothetical protein
MVTAQEIIAEYARQEKVRRSACLTVDVVQDSVKAAAETLGLSLADVTDVLRNQWAMRAG